MLAALKMLLFFVESYKSILPVRLGTVSSAFFGWILSAYFFKSVNLL